MVVVVCLVGWRGVCTGSWASGKAVKDSTLSSGSSSQRKEEYCESISCFRRGLFSKNEASSMQRSIGMNNSVAPTKCVLADSLRMFLLLSWLVFLCFVVNHPRMSVIRLSFSTFPPPSFPPSFHRPRGDHQLTAGSDITGMRLLGEFSLSVSSFLGCCNFALFNLLI